MRLSSGGRGEVVGGSKVGVVVGVVGELGRSGVLAKKGDSDGGVGGGAWRSCQ